MMEKFKLFMCLGLFIIAVVFISGCVEDKIPTKSIETSQSPTPTISQPTSTIPPTPAFVLQKVEETDRSFVWSGLWQSEQNPGASGGSWKTSTSSGAKVDITFNGTEITLLYAKLPGNGIASVKIDGIPYPDIDMYSQTPTIDKKVITSNLTNAKHVLTITVTSRRNPSADNNVVIVDAVDVTVPS